MRRLISSLIESLPALANVVIFLLFVFLLFGILGVQTFVGKTYYRCRTTERPENGFWTIDESIKRLCNKENGGQFNCPSGLFCGTPEDEPGWSLSKDNVSSNELIDYGIITFDHIGVGLLTIFQTITLEGWTKIMYNYMDSNLTPMAVLFFCLLVVFG